MKMSNYFKVLILCLLAVASTTQAQLQLGFYTYSCPSAEQIIQNFVHEHIHNAPSLAATLIRMHFHDCFVRVCMQFKLIYILILFCFNELHLGRIVRENPSSIPGWEQFFVRLYLPCTRTIDYQGSFSWNQRVNLNNNNNNF
jgi:hypothetical protein